MSVQTFSVTGMTCGHCVHAVTAEIGHLPGVTEVAVDLDAGGTSTVRVTADAELTDAQVAEALDEAGDYKLAAAG
jgi:copper chaperone CopZ